MNDGSFIFYARKQRERKQKTRPVKKAFEWLCVFASLCVHCAKLVANGWFAQRPQRLAKTQRHFKFDFASF